MSCTDWIIIRNFSDGINTLIMRHVKQILKSESRRAYKPHHGIMFQIMSMLPKHDQRQIVVSSAKNHFWIGNIYENSYCVIKWLYVQAVLEWKHNILGAKE